jgi:cytochrome c-type biogenesis protein CcmH
MAAVAALFLLALIRARADLASAADFDLKVYRDQLAEIDRDLARGTLPVDEADRLRTEVSRRLLEADRTAQSSSRIGSTGGIAAAAALMLVLIGASYWAYTRLGAPGYPDLPLAHRFAMSEETARKPPLAGRDGGTSRRHPPGPNHARGGFRRVDGPTPPSRAGPPR